MRRSLLRAVIVALSLSLAVTQSHAQVVISQFYGGGGFQPGGPVFDCLEIFNRGPTTQNLSGWSVQFTTATGATWNVVPLSGSIAPGQYMLIKTGVSFDANVGVILNYDFEANPLLDTSTFTSGNGRAAIVNSTTALVNTTGTCPLPNASVVDFLVVTTTNTCAEGGAGAAGGSTGANPPTNTWRKGGGCIDTDNNNADFEVLSPPNLRDRGNNAFIVVTGGTYQVVGTTSVGTPSAPAGASLTLTAARGAAACNPFGPTLTSVSADTSSLIGGSAGQAFTGTGPFTLNIPIDTAQVSGLYTIPITATDGTLSITTPYLVRITGAAPPNDQCAGATVVTTLTANIAADNSTATADVDPGTCNTGTAGNFGLWYVFTPLAPGTVVFDETSSQDVATGLWAVAGAGNPGVDCGTFTSTNGLCLGSETWAAKFIPGATYYLQVGASGTTAPTVAFNANLTWLSTPPANDECTTAEIIPASSAWPLSFSVDNRFATDDAIDTCSTTALTVAPNSVWYRYTPSISGSFSVAETSAQDVAIAVWDVTLLGGTCGSLTGSNVSQCTTSETITLSVVAGHDYVIMLHSELPSPLAPTVGMAGTFTQVLPPANDTCAGATILTAPTGVTAQVVDGRGALPDIGLSCNSAGFTATTTAGVWYRVDVPAGGDDYTMTFAENGTPDAVWGVFTGSCAGLTPYACYSADTANTVPVRAGQSYYLLLGTQGTNTPPTTTYTVTISFAVATSACCNTTLNTCSTQSKLNCAAQSPAGSWHGPLAVTCSTTTAAANACQSAPANDLCSGAIAMTAGAAAYSTAFPAAATDDADASCNSIASPAVATRFGVWYSYTTGIDGGTLRLNESSTNDVFFQQYSGTCGSLTPVSCSDPELNVDFLIPANTTHYFLMGLTSNTTTPTVAFSLTAVSFTASTGACCNGSTCTATAFSACPDYWVGANTSCVGTVTYSTPAAGNCAGTLEDISATGTSIFVDSPATPSLDDGSGPATIPFPFPFFENSYTSIRIGTNGLILFAPATITDANNRNITPVTLPSAAAPNNALYVLWDDLNATIAAAPNATIKYETRGTAGVDLRFIVQWNQLIHFNQPNDNHTFQAILFENGDIEYRYGVVHAWAATTWDFQIGIENATGTVAYTVNGPNIGGGNTCIRFVRSAAPGPCTVAGACCVGPACSIVPNAAACSGAFTLGTTTCGPSTCAPAGVCCRGATCTTVFTSSAACQGATTTSSTGGPGWAFVLTASPCNAGVNTDGTYSGALTSTTSPCCFANYNHSPGPSGLEVQDIFDFLNDWFAGRAIAIPGGDGTSLNGLAVQNIFNFLNAWFAGGCS